MDRLGLDRVHLVGTALGGFGCYDFALSFPQRLRSLVVANSIGGVQDPFYVELGRRIRPREFDATPPDFRELSASYRAFNPEGVKRFLDLEHMSRPPGARAPAQGTRNRITFDALSTLRMPVLLITGDADLYVPPPVLKLFADRIPGAQSLVLPEVGHSAYWEQPERFNRAVLEFIGRH